eukprot:GHVN01050566.1.p1 GENE.GHVN01050566.1~~GHVN01050566.1.p1  ORF type:complete len:309 (+),score=101.07 GHVN01050566.1:102-1028(+)
MPSSTPHSHSPHQHSPQPTPRRDVPKLHTPPSVSPTSTAPESSLSSPNLHSSNMLASVREPTASEMMITSLRNEVGSTLTLLQSLPPLTSLADVTIREARPSEHSTIRRMWGSVQLNMWGEWSVDKMREGPLRYTLDAMDNDLLNVSELYGEANKGRFWVAVKSSLPEENRLRSERSGESDERDERCERDERSERGGLGDGDEMIVGAIACKAYLRDCPADTPASEVTTGEFFRLFVCPQARRLGLARRLVEHAMNEMRVMGYTKVKLETSHPQISAIRLYLSLGYSLYSVYGFKDGALTVLKFEKDL